MGFNCKIKTMGWHQFFLGEMSQVRWIPNWRSPTGRCRTEPQQWGAQDCHQERGLQCRPVLVWSRLMQRTEFVWQVLGGCANYHYIDSSEEMCFLYYYTLIFHCFFSPQKDGKFLWFFRSSKFCKHGNHSCCVASFLIFTFFSLEVLLLKLSCTISPKRKQWAHGKQPSPHLPTHQYSL